ncbi:hypothetical protein KL86DES1_20931 [uncultured Desulfovibrio sp.]|uniref:Uncharacterized protein n=1 Tax=uncultured Desulfovibrio sp. TaxID=167968 RepID=A0A212L5Y1_9BACT|nr:hypothetical protein KL86DES1_20931 [uncultured Desulfovibrio sp.]VZH33834.1 conserved protein of unknown function [Desulfovibrio sp. 86]
MSKKKETPSRIRTWARTPHILQLEQINFEMFHISKFSFSRKCDFRLNPRHIVARCTLVQR